MRKFLESTTWNCFSGEEAPYRVWTYAPGLSAEHRRWSAVCGGAGRFDASSAQLAGSQLLSVEGRQAVVLQVRTPSQGFQSYSVHGRSLASHRSRWLSAQTIHQGSAKLESVNWSEDLFFQCTKSWEVVQTLEGTTPDLITDCDLQEKIFSYWDHQAFCSYRFSSVWEHVCGQYILHIHRELLGSPSSTWCPSFIELKELQPIWELKSASWLKGY